MNKDLIHSERSRTEILAELAAIPAAVQGSISPFNVTTSSGNTITYHKLQYWDGHKSVSRHIPNDKLPEYRAAVEGGRRAKDLLVELTATDAASIDSSRDALKKRSGRSPSRRRRSSP